MKKPLQDRATDLAAQYRTILIQARDESGGDPKKVLMATDWELKRLRAERKTTDDLINNIHQVQ